MGGKIVALAAIVLCSAAVTARAAPRTDCGARSHRTVLENRVARIYQAGSEIYGCVIGSRGGVHLGSDYGSSGSTFAVHPIRLSGHFAAYNRSECDNLQFVVSGPACSYDRVLVVDLRNRRRIVRHTYAHDEKVAELVLRPNGSIAWIDQVPSAGDSTRYVYTLHRFDNTGEAELASGEEAAGPGHLARSGTTIYWTQSGQPHSAPLR